MESRRLIVTSIVQPKKKTQQCRNKIQRRKPFAVSNVSSTCISTRVTIMTCPWNVLSSTVFAVIYVTFISLASGSHFSDKRAEFKRNGNKTKHSFTGLYSLFPCLKGQKSIIYNQFNAISSK